MSAESPQTLIDLHISCSSLKNLDVMSKSDPMCVVYLTEHRIGAPDTRVEVGRTEVIMNNLNPTFQKAIRITYRFEVFQELDFEVYDIDGTGVGDLSGDDLIGTVHTNVGDVVGKSSFGGFHQDLMYKGKEGSRGQLKVFTEEIRTESTATQLRIEMVGEHLDKKDLFGKSDPYVNIYRMVGGQRTLVHKTNIVYKTLDPVWSPFAIPGDKLGGLAHPEEMIVFECWDWDKVSSDDLIGEASVPLGDLLNPEIPVSMVLQHPKKVGKRNYNGSGVLRLNFHALVPKPSFLDFIQGGCRINLIASVDFTGSNGSCKCISSLHYIGEDHVNPYEKAICAVSRVLLPYDSDGKITAFGFGAKFPGKSVSMCFALNKNESDPEVVGTEGFLDVYRKAAVELDYWGPTNFSPSIHRAIEMAKEDERGKPGSSYTILMMLTDGSIDDMGDTIRAIVQGANTVPLSIVIVGVGDANFGSMEELDGDGGMLKDNRGNVASRDIVQFVPFRDFAEHPEQLASEVLAEIPSQLISYMDEHDGVIMHPSEIVH